MEQSWMATPWVIAALVGAGLVALGLVALVLTTSVYKHVICMKYLFSGWKAVVPLALANLVLTAVLNLPATAPPRPDHRMTAAARGM